METLSEVKDLGVKGEDFTGLFKSQTPTPYWQDFTKRDPWVTGTTSDRGRDSNFVPVIEQTSWYVPSQ